MLTSQTNDISQRTQHIDANVAKLLRLQEQLSESRINQAPPQKQVYNPVQDYIERTITPAIQKDEEKPTSIFDRPVYYLPEIIADTKRVHLIKHCGLWQK